jgi:hypothetical protein
MGFRRDLECLDKISKGRYTVLDSVSRTKDPCG